MPKRTQSQFASSKPFSFPALNQGKNPKRIRLIAEPTGDPDVYQEIRVGALCGKKCIANVLIGLDANGNLRVLSTAANDGNGDPGICIFPEALKGEAVAENVVDYPYTILPNADGLLEFTTAIKDWVGDSKPKTAEGQTRRSDAKDLKNILRLAKRGNLAEARTLAHNLDTAVRDVIPETIWNALQAAN